MTAPCQSVCTPWATVDDLCEPCTPETPRIEEFLGATSDVLFELSGQRWPGSCLDTVRPDTRCPVSQRGGICFQSSGCICTRLAEVRFGEVVTRVDEVRVDGVVLPSSSYRVDDHRSLVRLDGGTWPCCQDMAAPTTEPYTFEVTFVYGTPPPPMGRLAAAELACELARACTGDEACRLSPRVINVARQGVAIQLASLSEALQSGKTGLPVTDLFLHTYNPTGQRRQSSVWTPDMAGGSRRAGT